MNKLKTSNRLRCISILFRSHVFLTKICGFFYFSFNRNPKSVQSSKFLVAYGVFIALLVILITPWSIFRVLRLGAVVQPTTLLAVTVFQFVTQYFHTAMAYVYLLRHLRVYQHTIRQALIISRELGQHQFQLFTSDKKFVYRVLLQLVCFVVLTRFAVAHILETTFEVNSHMLFHTLFILGLDGNWIILTNVYVGGLLFAAHSYRHLNKNLKLIMLELDGLKSTNVTRYCQLSDRVDILNQIHSDIASFLGNLNRLFAPYILLTTLNEFVTITAQVFLIYLFTFTNIKHNYGNGVYGDVASSIYLIINLVNLYLIVYASNIVTLRVSLSL